MIDEGLFAHLSADAGVAALAGSRIYPLVIPQQSFREDSRQPCVVYSRDGAQRQKLFGGTSDMVSSAFTIDSYAPTLAAAQALADAVRVALLDFSGVMGATTVRAVFLENEFELADLEPGLYRVSQSWTIWHVGA